MSCAGLSIAAGLDLDQHGSGDEIGDVASAMQRQAGAAIGPRSIQQVDTTRRIMVHTT
jgi:hypothetical protein